MSRSCIGPLPESSVQAVAPTCRKTEPGQTFELRVPCTFSGCRASLSIQEECLCRAETPAKPSAIIRTNAPPADPRRAGAPRHHLAAADVQDDPPRASRRGPGRRRVRSCCRGHLVAAPTARLRSPGSGTVLSSTGAGDAGATRHTLGIHRSDPTGVRSVGVRDAGRARPDRRRGRVGDCTPA